MYESLHNHTIASDGVLTRIELLEEAESKGIGVMAITDHDAVPSEADLKDLREYTGPVKWLVGVELSSWVPLAVGGPEKGAVHILGLFVDPRYQPLVEFCAQAEESRLRRMRIYVEHLTGLGFDVTEEDIRKAATSRNIGKPHMVKAVLAKPENHKVMDELRERMRKDGENNPSVKSAYDQMMKEGPKQYPYAMFMGSHAYFPVVDAEAGGLLDFEATVKLIRDAGGVAIFAHWYMDKAKVPEEALEAVLAAGGLDGLETSVANVISNRDVSSEVRYLRELVKKYDLIEEVGSDSHTVADLEAFVADPVAKYSVGQTARILERVKPDLSWSNL